jgi:hypothetical protein
VLGALAGALRQGIIARSRGDVVLRFSTRALDGAAMERLKDELLAAGLPHEELMLARFGGDVWRGYFRVYGDRAPPDAPRRLAAWAERHASDLTQYDVRRLSWWPNII